MREKGFYIIKDKFFEDMQQPYLKGNKKESRPHYYCIRDNIEGIYWMIPLSSKVEKYQRIIEQKARKVMKLLRNGVKFTFTQADVGAILIRLKSNLKIES